MKPLYKMLIIAGVLIVAGGAVYLAWQKLTAPAAVPEAELGMPLPAGTSGGVLPGSATSGSNEENGTPAQIQTSALILRKISESPAFDFWVVEGTGEIYYLTPEGKVMDLKEGPDLEISTQTLTALNRVAAAPGGGRVLAAFGDPRTPQWAYFDIIDRSWHTLPQSVQTAAWAGRVDQVVALVQNGSETNLSLLNLSQAPTAVKVVLRDVSLEDITMWFQNPEQFIISERPSAYYASRVWRLDLKTLSFNSVFTPERGLLITPVRNGEAALKWSGDRLFVLDHDFGHSEELPFSTFPEKCTASPDMLYCFVPRDPFPGNLPLPDAYFQNKFHTVDSLITAPFPSSSLPLGKSESPWASTADTPVDAKNPVYLNGSIYFINRYDNYIYKLTLGTAGN
ncbi:MAG: hypothetical protein V1696_00230 [Candidatus Jorgensenbacteria bacterium]